MSIDIRKELCILCNSEASVKNTDYDNRRWYKCTNPECGEYEISVRAIRRIEGSPAMKELIQKRAQACVGTDEILEVIIGDDNQPAINYRPRPV